MKKELIYLVIGLIIVGAIAWLLIFILHPSEDTSASDGFSQIPGKFTALGPYAKNINFTENIGNYALNICAERLYVKKGKFMGFDSALKRNYVMNKYHLTLYKQGKKMFEVYKDHFSMNPLLKTIEIDSPQVIHPVNNKQPIKIKLDKDKKLYTIYYKNKTDVWNLAN
jgi:hypothetical protein